MRLEDYSKEYSKLAEAYPDHFSSKHRRAAIANYVMDLDYKFWWSIVNRILVSGNPRLDIEDAARGERLAKKRIKDTNAMLNLERSLSDHCSNNGLENILEKMGVKSLTDFLDKRDMP